MSNYRNFFADFPTRCAEFLPEVLDKKREVTLMLSIAMPTIVIPLERLAGPRQTTEGERRGHPARDWERFDGAKSKLDDLLQLAFKASILWPTPTAVGWCFGSIADVSKPPDDWPELQNPKPLGPNKTVKAVVSHVRNALAHGSIVTCGETEIDNLVFLSECAPNTFRFNYLSVSPRGFQTFLRAWLAFLQTLDLPDSLITERGRTAA